MSRRKQATEGDFEAILRNGLSSNRSYVVLTQKTRSPVVLQFRPLINRINDKVIYLGGKLSAFPDPSNDKIQGLGEVEIWELLKSSWRKLPQDRSDPVRVGSHAGFQIIAGYSDFKNLMTKFDKAHMLHELMTGIEKALNVEIDNPDDVKGYLSFWYRKHIEEYFNSEDTSQELGRAVGKRTDLLLGQSYQHGGPSVEALMVENGIAISESVEE